MNKIVKNYIYNVLYNMLVLLVPLFTAPYLARVLGADRLGIYSYINSTTSIIISISLIGLSSYGSRQVAYKRDNKDKLSKTFADIMAIRLLSGFVGTLIYFAYARFTNYQDYFVLYYIYYFGNVIDCTWLFVGVEDMKISAMKNILAKSIAVAGIFLLVQTKDDLWKYVLILAVANFIGMVVSYPQLRKYIYVTKPDSQNLFSHYKGAVILFLPSLVSTIYLQVDKVMIEWITGSTNQISFYDQAEKIVMIPLTFITVLSTVMMPRIANEFAHENNYRIAQLLSKVCKVSMFMACPLMFGLAAIANNFIPWYLGTEFMATATVLIILSPIVISNTLIGISGSQFFIATNQIRILLISNSLAAMINIFINAILIPDFGCIGAAVATLVSNYILVFVQYKALSRQLQIRKMFKNTSRYFVAAFVMYVVVFFLGKHRSATPITTLVQVAIGGLIYFLIMFMGGDEFLYELLQRMNTKFKQK